MNRLSWAYISSLPSRLLSRTRRLAKATQRAAKIAIKGGHLELLPGCRFARYALPVDYPPSRRHAPRYGTTQPPIPQLMDWFEENTDRYRDFLREMRNLPLGHIAKNLNDTRSPNPAFVGGPITAFDSLVLYTMIVKHRPQTYIEIGSGMTTCFARQAIDDFKTGTRLVSVDPQPRCEIDAICDEVVRNGLETCDLTLFDRLVAGDIVFLDGSHRSFMNSDVTVFFLDVLPRLKPGVIIHLHDIHLPWDYPEMFVDWYWNEQYMLAVYLINAKHRIDPVLPTAFIGRMPQFQSELAIPFADLGPNNHEWKSGGSMWFTHLS